MHIGSKIFSSFGYPILFFIFFGLNILIHY